MDYTKAALENSSGYTITVTDSNLYTFSASSGTATTGNQRGGGDAVRKCDCRAGDAGEVNGIYICTTENRLYRITRRTRKRPS